MLTQAIPKHKELSTRQAGSLWFVFATILFVAASSLAAVVGGMQYLTLALAVWMCFVVYDNPKEAVPAGTIFLLAVNVLFPSEARFDAANATEPWEMYYWAFGLLIITLAALARLGVRKFVRLPVPVLAFSLVVVLSTLVGFRFGGSLSYVSRQCYGSVLLVSYFALAYYFSDEELFLRRLRTFGLTAAFVFFVYYAAVFGELGFHKEITTLGTLEAIIAILCVITGVTRNEPSWIVSGLVISSVPWLLFSRHAILTFIFGIVIALAMRASTKKSKLVLYSTAILLLVPSIFPDGAQIVLEQATAHSAAIEKMLPEGGRDVTSLVDRNLELLAGLEVLQKSPLVGEGFGNELAWDSPARGAMSQAYVDNGWAYIAVKMGGLGLIVFGWFLFMVLRCVSRDSLAISASVLVIVLVAQFSEPAFFQFTTSPLFGALAGLLCARRKKADLLRLRVPAPATLSRSSALA